MAERHKYDQGLVNVGRLLTQKRKMLGQAYQTREQFINLRSEELFSGKNWISLRHLTNLELGKNWISIEKLLLLATALEETPTELFSEIINTYQNGQT